MLSRDADVREILDGDSYDDATLAASLRDVRHINTLLGWRRLLVREVARIAVTEGWPTFSLLDVATGSADLPLAVARWARQSRTSLRIVATDLNPRIVAIARHQAKPWDAVTVEQADALALPYATGSFDLAMCSLALHHFSPEQATKLLDELARVGRRVLVCDLVRAPLAYVGVQLLTHVLRMQPMTRHDAAASVRRGYTAAEVRALARRTRLRDPHVRVSVPYRLMLTAGGIGKQ